MCEVAAAAAESLRQGGRGDPELVKERDDRAGFFDYTQVLAGDVLDQRELDGLPGVDGLGDECRNGWDAGDLGRTPAAFARDQFVAPAVRGWTTIGCNTPRSRIESASAASERSSKRSRARARRRRAR